MYNKCKQSVTPSVNEDFTPTDFIYTNEVLEVDSGKTQKQINNEFREEIKYLKRMLVILQRQIDEEI